MTDEQKPPLGVMTEVMWRERRASALIAAIGRMPVPWDVIAYPVIAKQRMARAWVIELGEHLKWIADREANNG